MYEANPGEIDFGSSWREVQRGLELSGAACMYIQF